MLPKIVKENIIKNILLLLLLILLYFPTDYYLTSNSHLTNNGIAGNLLVAVSIILVTACFGNFAFTYEKINVKIRFERYFAHALTSTLLLVIGIHLILTSVLVRILAGRLILIDITLFLLYVACIGYDFFDLFKVMHQSYKI